MKIPLTTKKLTSPEEVVQIEFWRGWTKHPRLGKFRHTTHCEIRIGGIHSSGPAWTHPRDSYSFEYGARVAFKKAVAGLPRPLRRGPWRLYLENVEKFKIKDAE